MSILTDDTKVGVDREYGAPMNFLELVPPGIHFPGIIREPRQHVEAEQIPELYQVGRTERQTLQQEIRQVKVGGFGEILRQQILGRGGILDQLGDGSRRGRGHGGDQEDLDDLKGKIGVLCVQFDTAHGG